MNELRNWILSGLAVAALVPLAVNQWHDICARSAEGDEGGARLEDVRAALEAKQLGEAVVAARAAAFLSPTSSEARAVLVDAEIRMMLDAPERTAVAEGPRIGARLRRASTTATGEELARLQVALGNLALVLGQGDPVAWYRLAAATHAECPEAHFYLGNALVLGLKHADAEAPLKKARQLMPGDARPLVALGIVYEELKKWALANQALTEASELSPRADIYARLGRVRIEQEKWAEAVEALELARKGTALAEQAPLLEHLGRALFRLGKYGPAIGHLAQSNALAPSINTLFRLGIARQSAGQHGLAAGIFASITDQDPNAGEAHARLIESLAAAGHADAARAAAARFRRLAVGSDDMARFAGVVDRALEKLQPK